MRKLILCQRAGYGGSKFLLLMLVGFLASFNLIARDIYVDQAHDGTQSGTISQPYKTISQAAAVAQPGDIVYVRAGVYREEVIPANSGTAGSPITFMPYNGEEVVINGTELITGWQPAAGLANTYVANVSQSFVSKIGQHNQVFVDGVMIHLARFPDFTNIADVSRPVKLISDRIPASPIVKTSEVELHGDAIYEVTFEDDALSGTSVDWTGGWIWMQHRGFNWANSVKGYNDRGEELTTDNAFSDWDPFFEGRAYKVKSHVGNRITYYSTANAVAESNMQYYLFNKKEGIDANGEWWLDTSVTPNKLYVRTPDGDDPSTHKVEFKVRDYAFNLDPGNFAGAAYPDLNNHPEITESIRGNIPAADSGRSHITIKGFQLFGASITTDKSSGYGGQTKIEYPWRDEKIHGLAKSTNVIIDGIDARYINHFYSVRNQVQFVWGSSGAITLSGTNHQFTNSTLRYTAGAGVLLVGKRHRVFNNTISDVGYSGTMSGGVTKGLVSEGYDHEIAYNTITAIGSHGIYFSTLRNSNPANRIARVHHNVISDFGIQMVADVGGIYSGFVNQANARFDHNIIFNDNRVPIGAGVYLDFGTDMIVDHNIVYDVGTPLKYNRGDNNNKILDLKTQFLNNVSIPWSSGSGFSGNRNNTDDEGFIFKNNISTKGFSLGAKVTSSNNLVNVSDSIFVNAAGRNYQLASPGRSAAAIDKGVSVAPYDDPIAGSAPDIGAYEYGKPAPTIGVIGAYTPTLTSLRLNPVEARIPTRATQQFVGTALDQYDAPIESELNFDWSVKGNGTISPTGLYTAPATDGVDTVKAAKNGIIASAPVTIQQLLIEVAAENTRLSVDLTSGTSISGSDWIHFGNGSSSSTPVDRKSNGGSQISNYTTLGIFQPSGFKAGDTFAYTDRSLSWTDGTPTSTAIADSLKKGGVFVNSGPGGGFSISAPSGKSTRTLTLFVSGFKMVGRVSVSLEDGNTSTILYTDTMSTKATGTADEIIQNARLIPQFDRTITIKYSTPTQARIAVSWTMAQAETGGGWAGISGATLSFSDTNRVATRVQLTPDTANVEVGLSRQFKATVLDQDDAPLKTQPAFSWTVSGGGSIDATGLFTAGNTAGGPYTVSAGTAGASGTNIVGTSIVNVRNDAATIKYTATAPVLDNKIDAAWSNAPSYEIKKLVDGTAPANAADLSASFQSLYDQTNLYFLVQVKDNIIQKGDNNNDLYNDDGIELYLDRGNKKRTAAMGYGSDDFQYGFRADSIRFREYKRNATSGVSYTSTPVDGGYVLEIQIPWSTIGTRPGNSFLGLDMGINDDDNGGGLERRLSWFNKANTSYFDPSALGIGKLDSTAVDPPVTNCSKFASASTNIVGTNGSWNNIGNTKDKAMDGDINTFFDAPTGDGNWVGLDLGSARTICKVRYYPRATFTSRMVGGKVQGSTTSDFSSGTVTDLATVSSEPSLAWTELAITNTTAFRYVRYLSPDGGYGNVAEVEFDVSSAPALALRNPENPASTAAGLDYSYYEGTWSALPNFDALTAAKQGNVTSFDLAPRNRNDNFGFAFTGFVEVPSDGTYTFYTTSDDGSKLFIGSTQVVNNDGVHAPQERSGTIGLKAGRHAITVTFFEATVGEVLTVSYSGPGVSKQTIPASALSRSSTSSGFRGTYKITARHSSKALDVSSGSTADGANVQQWTANGTGAQQWIITATTGGYYKIVNKGSSKALEVAGSGTSDGSNVQQWSYIGANNQQWSIEATTDGFYRLLNRNSGKALDVNGGPGATQDGVNVHQWGYLSGTNQQWKLELLSTATARTAGDETAGSRRTSELSLKLHPNPASREVTIDLSGFAGESVVEVKMMDMTGQSFVRQQVQLLEGKKQETISVSHLPQGMYLVRIQGRKTGKTGKLVIAK